MLFRIRFVFIGLASLTAMSYLGCSPTSKVQADHVVAFQNQLKLHDDTLVLNGKPLILGASVKSWSNILGISPRYVDRAGGMWVWDSLGILVTAKHSDTGLTRHVASCWVLLRHRDVDFWPRQIYSGKIWAHTGDSLRHVSTQMAYSTWLDSSWPWAGAVPSLTSNARMRFQGNAGDNLPEALIVQGSLW